MWVSKHEARDFFTPGTWLLSMAEITFEASARLTT